ncbi:hypothetical protein P152DRAFT_389726 [Eremomyces bilateralis CBS 781.70]|uniref:Chalcone isomerase domain-containing protein n=1 Tax=Eremomyces bilateralis CBS 781.70 TaxID=1392243 RepID=A0A6G1GEN7_9PEZI|nr:uncharacterized protein P152DRAFT_389726 [Eremomyces bilateralis CBS 781.70]KAF1816575.1 hypothetical protein P152DRAFT_389726 [Eremomyces bilateralis CBS 781.70]
MLQIGHPDNLSKEKDQQKRAREVTVRVQPRESSVSSSGWSGTERCDAPPSKDASTFLGKPVVVAPGGEKLIVKDESGMDIELVPTGTSSIPHFPKTIHLPHPTNNADTSEYTLLGLGIRSVSFLSIQVYVVGLYVRTASLPALQSTLVHRVNPTATALIPSEKADLRTALLDPDASYQLWDAVLADPAATKVDTALRVVPTRSTDFNHLRDGWVTGIKARTAAAQKAGDASFADESFAESMRGFQAALAGRGSAPKGSVIVLRRKEQGELEMLFQKREKVEGRGVGGEWEGLGTVEDERVARLLWLGYLGGKKVSSEGVRKAVVEGCMELVERPTGTLATRVE